MISQTYYVFENQHTRKCIDTQAIFVSWVELLIIVLPWFLLFTVIFFLTGIHSSFWKRGFQDLKILSTDIVINNFFTLQLPWILIWVKKKNNKIIFPISLNLPSRHWKLFEVLNYIHCASRGLLFRQDPLLFPNNWSCKEEKGYLLHRLVKIN